MEKNAAPDLPGKPSGLRTIFNQEFIASAIIPLVIFYIFNFWKMTLAGIILSGSWCVGVILMKLIRERKVNVIALLAGIMAAIGLAGTVIARNPAFYLAAPILSDALYALVFFGSLLFPRSLVQIIVEDSHLGMFPESLRQAPKYRTAWRILTVAWGVLNVIQGLLRGILLYTVPVALYYTISTLFTNISNPLMIFLSYWFPKWYWHRKV